MQAFMTTLFDTAADAGAARQGGWSYRGAPGVLITRQTFDSTGGRLTQRSGIDILTTGRRGTGADGNAAPLAAVSAGVAETLAERIMANAIAVTLEDSPAASDGGWGILSEAGGLGLAKRAADLPEARPGTLAAMEADLDHGQILALADNGAAWWRVDPVTGATIGVDHNGNGGESVEYITALDYFVTKSFAVYGTISCAEAGGNGACCLATNVEWAGVGKSVWGLVGKGLESIKGISAAAAGWTGLVGGAGASATGWNPYQGLC
jgi:hypothetical protein